VRVYADKGLLDRAAAFIKRIEEWISGASGVIFNGTGELFSMGKSYSWENIFLPDTVVETLRHNVSYFLKNREFFREHGVPCKRGILFCGPPGNGKTLVGKILACQSGINFIWVTSKDISYMECNCHKDGFALVYELARRLSPCVVFIEDVDLLIGEGRTDLKARLGSFLNELDGFDNNKHVITIATTNFPEVLDKAISERPGRFDVKIRFDNPDHATRLGILKLYCRSFKLGKDADLEEVGRETEGFSCAAVREVLTRALIRASERSAFNDGGAGIEVGREDLLGSVSFLSNGKVKMGFEADKAVTSD
jgi:cell division protease FtsH